MATLVCLQHNLTLEQLEELGGEVINLRSVNEDLFAHLANSPADEFLIRDLAIRLCYMIWNRKFSKVLLPIGSPAFMFMFARELTMKLREYDFQVEVLFAHSNRVSMEHVTSDGGIIKTSEFRHVRFLSFSI